ncbi:hypothetical protein BCR34DRAFT_560510 [Clohesyomyces aquaticus]|uniref:Arrestin-like N-terminal domain-containing protein n=1 Tax=Clohesyomyces aquaticus TaxID=1231657 RepID=A0A1Y1ZW67_9PLEO|nr:hypothetical protein BCR34DRAFT_560510 [Clohesyomyces aquaticus]
MGLFKSSKHVPQEPLPSLELHLLDDPDRVFKPDETVAGHIVLTTPIPIKPQALEVTLWGKSETWIRTEHKSENSTTYYHYRDHAPLFDVTSNVAPKGETFVPGQVYKFPFGFRVPAGTGYERSGIYEKPQDGVWTVGPHNLPPTFWHGARVDGPDNCSISYGVTVRLTPPEVVIGKDNEPISCTAPILFQPLNPYAHIQVPNLTRQDKSFSRQSSVLAGQEPSTLGFRQRLHDRFSSATPKLDFTLGVELPDLLTTGSEFNFRTTFTVAQRSENVAHIPPITFKVVKLELLDFTFFRAPRDWQASNTMSGSPSKYRDKTPRGKYRADDQVNFEEKKTLLNAVPPSQVVELAEVEVPGEKKMTEQGLRCDAWFTGRVPGFTPPSFRSFAITRSYRVKVKVQVGVAGKEFECSAESTDCEMGSVHT